VIENTSRQLCVIHTVSINVYNFTKSIDDLEHSTDLATTFARSGKVWRTRYDLIRPTGFSGDYGPGRSHSDEMLRSMPCKVAHRPCSGGGVMVQPRAACRRYMIPVGPGKQRRYRGGKDNLTGTAYYSKRSAQTSSVSEYWWKLIMPVEIE
jgi:hypothetical protein